MRAAVPRNYPQYMFLQKGVPKICSKFTEEHLCRSTISIKLQRVFFCKYAALFPEHLFLRGHLKSCFSLPEFKLLAKLNVEPKWHLKDTLKAFDDFKNKQKSVWSNVFWYLKAIHYNTHVKTQMLKNTNVKNTNVKKISFGQNKWYKKIPSFFFCELQLITVLLLISDFYMR